MTGGGGPQRWDRPDLPAGHTPPSAGSDGPGAPHHEGAPGPSPSLGGEPDGRRGGPRAPVQGSVQGSGSGSDGDPLGWDLFDDAEEDGPTPEGRRTRLLLAAAIVPWLIVGAVLLRTPGDPDVARSAAHHGDGAHGVVEDAEGHPSDPAHDPVTAGTDPWGPSEAWDAWGDPGGDVWGEASMQPDALLFGTRVAAGPGEAAAVGMLVARQWLGGVGTPIDLDVGTTSTDTYVEHLVVEDVDMPAPDAAVVTVIAVVLTVDDGAYADADAVRVAVPVHLAREGARPAGEPWRLPAPDLRSADLGVTPAEDPALATAAGTALAGAGYRSIDVVSVATTESWPIVVTADAVAPGESAHRRHHVWVRRHLDALVVAGWLPDVTTDADGRPIDARADRTEQDGGAPSPATTPDDS